MSNMSYCRFENTLKDLRDCYDNWPNNDDDLSDTEKKAKDRMLKLIREMAEDIMG